MYSALIIVPFASVIFLNLFFKDAMRRLAFWLALALVTFQMYAAVFPKAYAWCSVLDAWNPLATCNFSVDVLSRVLLFCIGIVLFSTLCAERYLSNEPKRLGLFVNITLLALAGMNGIAIVRDIFSLYVFLEITAVSSFILIVFNKEGGAFEAAFKYVILSIVATVFMLTALALLLMVAGDTSFAALRLAVRSSPDSFIVTLAIGIFLCACFIKSGLMPFHGWLPDAYSAAPASVSILLAGIVTKSVGVYTLLRLVSAVFGFGHSLQQILLVVGTISVVVAALAALGQNDFKRMLAYSSISQVGYIIVGLATGTALGLAGAILHLFNHSIFKSLLFLNSAAVERATGTRSIDTMSGLAKKMPATGLTSVIGVLSAAGIPPLAGFWSKLIIIIALWMKGFYTFGAIAILASVLTLGYFLVLQRSVFFGTLKEELANIREAGFGLIFPALILASIIIGVGIIFPFVLTRFLISAGSVLGG